MISLEKKELRNAILACRSYMVENAMLSESICKKIRTLELPQHVGAFYSANNEPDILPALIEMGKTIYLPKIDGANLLFFEWKKGDDLIENRYGIMEPSGKSEPKMDIKVFIVPCIAASHDFYRLGYGGGYYDRLKSQYTEKPIFYGVVYERFLLPAIPHEPHDQKLDAIITENGIHIS